MDNPFAEVVRRGKYEAGEGKSSVSGLPSDAFMTVQVNYGYWTTVTQ